MNVMVDLPNRVVYCQLLDSFPDTPSFVCSINYGLYPNNCNDMSNTSSTLDPGRAGNNVTIDLRQDLMEAEYCYTVSVSYGADTLMVCGTFSLCEYCVSSADACQTGYFCLVVCSVEDLGTRSTGQTVTVPNGIVMYTGVNFSSTATLTCDSGYQPSPESGVRTCESDGNWSNQEQRCIVTAAQCKLQSN